MPINNTHTVSGQRIEQGVQHYAEVDRWGSFRARKGP